MKFKVCLLCLLVFPRADDLGLGLVEVRPDPLEVVLCAL